MNVKDLVGKIVVRTKPITMQGEKDYSYIEEPLKILKVTDTHIVAQPRDSMLTSLAKFVNVSVPVIVLGFQWIDDNWIDYEVLTNVSKDIDDLTPEDFK